MSQIDAEVVLPAMAAIAAAYVLVPTALIGAWEARRAFPVSCPETGAQVQVRISAARAALAIFTGGDQRVCGCERWPDKAGCDRACERQLRG